VARLGGVSAAVRAANLTQPAVTQAIAALEKNFGTPLFARAARVERLLARGSPARGVLERARAVDIDRNGDVDCGAHANLLDCCPSLDSRYCASVERAPPRAGSIRIPAGPVPAFRGVSMKVSTSSKMGVRKDWSERRDLNSVPLHPISQILLFNVKRYTTAAVVKSFKCEDTRKLFET
jgi:hypothetical protein